jgi:hypothetical protein
MRFDINFFLMRFIIEAQVDSSTPPCIFFQNACLLHIKYKSQTYITEEWWEELMNYVVNYHSISTTEGSDEPIIVLSDHDASEAQGSSMLDALWETEYSSQNSPIQAPLGDAIEAELVMFKKHQVRSK